MTATYDGATADSLAASLSLPRVVVLDQVPSTMDVANELASSGAPGGTLVLADTQLAGRGRAGRRWESRPGDGIWLTLLTIPLVASGGAGTPEHFRDVFRDAGVDAALAASVFHSGAIPIPKLKTYLAAERVEVRT